MSGSYFKLKEHKTAVKTEIIACITTFLTMAYIIIVNPMILSPDAAEPNQIPPEIANLENTVNNFMRGKSHA